MIWILLVNKLFPLQRDKAGAKERGKSTLAPSSADY